MVRIHYLFFLFFLFSPLLAHNTAYVLIHGTWASTADWHQEGGDFYDTLSCVIDTSDTIISFFWSGNCYELERRSAGIALAHFLESLEKNKTIVLIGHSHGGNVALHAIEYIAQHALTIFTDCVILLGTPLAHDYTVTCKNTIINIFSFSDIIQPICGLFKRTLSGNARISNLSININKIEPNHEELHAPLIAFHIPALHKTKDVIFEKCLQNACQLQLNYFCTPYIAVEYNQKERLLDDQLFQNYLLSSLLSFHPITP